MAFARSGTEYMPDIRLRWSELSRKSVNRNVQVQLLKVISIFTIPGVTGNCWRLSTREEAGRAEKA